MKFRNKNVIKEANETKYWAIVTHKPDNKQKQCAEHSLEELSKTLPKALKQWGWYDVDCFISIMENDKDISDEERCDVVYDTLARAFSYNESFEDVLKEAHNSRISLGDLTDSQIQNLPSRFLCLTRKPGFTDAPIVFGVVEKEDFIQSPDECFVIDSYWGFAPARDVYIATDSDIKEYEDKRVSEIKNQTSKYKKYLINDSGFNESVNEDQIVYGDVGNPVAMTNDQIRKLSKDGYEIAYFKQNSTTSDAKAQLNNIRKEFPTARVAVNSDSNKPGVIYPEDYFIFYKKSKTRNESLKEDIDEPYVLYFFDNTAGRERRSVTADDIDDFHEETLTSEELANYIEEEGYDSIEEFITDKNYADVDDGSQVIYLITRGNNILVDNASKYFRKLKKRLEKKLEKQMQSESLEEDVSSDDWEKYYVSDLQETHYSIKTSGGEADITYVDNDGDSYWYCSVKPNRKNYKIRTFNIRGSKEDAQNKVMSILDKYKNESLKEGVNQNKGRSLLNVNDFIKQAENIASSLNLPTDKWAVKTRNNFVQTAYNSFAKELKPIAHLGADGKEYVYSNDNKNYYYFEPKYISFALQGDLAPWYAEEIKVPTNAPTKWQNQVIDLLKNAFTETYPKSDNNSSKYESLKEDTVKQNKNLYDDIDLEKIGNYIAGRNEQYITHEILDGSYVGFVFMDEDGEETEKIYSKEDIDFYNSRLTEDTIKQNKKWVNKGKEGTHGKFSTKKEADAQRKAMFANGYKESLDEAHMVPRHRIVPIWDSIYRNYGKAIADKAIKAIQEIEDKVELEKILKNIGIISYDIERYIKSEFLSEDTTKESKRKAMFANGYKESLKEEVFDDDYDREFYKGEDGSFYKQICHKIVYDSDGFTTDYTGYMKVTPSSSGTNKVTFVFVFGDNDLYAPEDGYYDFETDSLEEAQEWFENYNGFEEEDSYYDFMDDLSKDESLTESTRIQAHLQPSADKKEYYVEVKFYDNYSSEDDFNEGESEKIHVWASNKKELENILNNDEYVEWWDYVGQEPDDFDESLKEGIFGNREYYAYNPDLGWTEDDIELHKSIDWAARNYEDYDAGEPITSEIVLYGFDEPEYAKVEMHKFIRSNPIFPPYYQAAMEKPFGMKVSYVGPMYDGNMYGKYQIHDRYESYELYDRLSDSLETTSGKTIVEMLNALDMKYMNEDIDQFYDLRNMYESIKYKMTPQDKQELKNKLNSTDDPELISSFLSQKMNKKNKGFQNNEGNQGNI